MSLPVSDFIATEARFSAPQLRSARRDFVTRRRRLGVGYLRQPLSRLPLRLLGGEPGPLPSEDSGRYGGTGGQADVDLPRNTHVLSSPSIQASWCAR
jgi:hypothetical protein